MSIQIETKRVALYAVLWPVYRIMHNDVQKRCCRIRIGARHWVWGNHGG